MKEALIRIGPKVEIIDSPIPKPGPNDVITKVFVSGSNPKDWKSPEWHNSAINQGDDIAGIVHAIGSSVTEFSPGDRVAAFHQIRAPHGSYAEYALSPAHTTFHLPREISFEEAATIPLAAMTAAVGLYVRLGLPEPWKVPTKPIPLVVYGAASAVGAYVIQLAQKSGIHPLICVAGKGAPFVEKLIDRSKGDTIIDYREGDEAVIMSIQAAIPSDQSLQYAYDAVSEKTSFINLGKVFSNQGSSIPGKITLVLPLPKDAPKGSIPTHVTTSQTIVYSVFDPPDIEFANAWFRNFSLGLKEGWLKPHPYEVRPGGLAGVEQALADLKNGKASAIKYVFRIPETKGAGSD